MYKRVATTHVPHAAAARGASCAPRHSQVWQRRGATHDVETTALTAVYAAQHQCGVEARRGRALHARDALADAVRSANRVSARGSVQDGERGRTNDAKHPTRRVRQDCFEERSVTQRGARPVERAVEGGREAREACGGGG